MEIATPKYAGFWVRFAATLLDGIFLQVAFYILGFVVGIAIFTIDADIEIDSKDPIFVFISIAIFLIYEVGMTASKFQGTFGKKIVNIKVVDENGNRLSLGRSVGRYFTKWLSAVSLLIGFMMAGWTKKKRALHDLLVNTYVVYR